jgi:hypothetical protein
LAQVAANPSEQMITVERRLRREVVDIASPVSTPSFPD